MSLRPGPGNGVVNIRKTIIAESLGVSYRHLEKVMSDMVEEGLLDKEGKKYKIVKRKEMEKLAEALHIF